VRLPANPNTISGKRQNGEIATSSLVLIIKGSKVPQILFKQDIKEGGVWYRVELMNVGPDSRRELCCGLGHIANKCSSKPK